MIKMVCQRKKMQRKTKYNAYRNKLRIKTLPNNITHVTLSLVIKCKLEKRLRGVMDFQNDSKQFLLL